MLIKTFVILLLIIVTECRKHKRRCKQSRIYNGEETSQGKIGRYPVQIFVKGHFHCSGTMIARYNVLTAAHCIVKYKLNDIYVVSDETYSLDTKKESRNYVVDYRTHPTHNGGVGDVAVMKVENPMSGNPIPLCSKQLHGGMPVTIFGWGRANTYIEGKPLRRIDIHVVHRKDCEKFGPIPENMICAGNFDGKKVCYGDSGGPLVYNGQVCGVTSSTFGCDSVKFPDIFMSVNYYKDWIISSMHQMDKLDKQNAT